MSNMQDNMIDLETAGTGSRAVVLSIGIVKFDRKTGETGDELYHKFSQIGLNLGRLTTKETMEWWARQDQAIKDEAFSGEEDLGELLADLHKFIGPKEKVWGNGSTFDLSILEDAYNYDLLLPTPWAFWNVRDVRTVMDLATGLVSKGKPPKGAHDPIVDCKHQIGYLCRAIEALTQ